MDVTVWKTSTHFNCFGSFSLSVIKLTILRCCENENLNRRNVDKSDFELLIFAFLSFVFVLFVG